MAYPCPGFPSFINLTIYTPVFRSDYAASCGDSPDYLGPDWYCGPTSLAVGDAMTAAEWASWPPSPKCTGIVYIRSKVKIADITDGTSNTYQPARNISILTTTPTGSAQRRPIGTAAPIGTRTVGPTMLPIVGR